MFGYKAASCWALTITTVTLVALVARNADARASFNSILRSAIDDRRVIDDIDELLDGIDCTEHTRDTARRLYRLLGIDDELSKRHRREAASLDLAARANSNTRNSSRDAHDEFMTCETQISSNSQVAKTRIRRHSVAARKGSRDRDDDFASLFKRIVEGLHGYPMNCYKCEACQPPAKCKDMCPRPRGRKRREAHVVSDGHGHLDVFVMKGVAKSELNATTYLMLPDSQATEAAATRERTPTTSVPTVAELSSGKRDCASSAPLCAPCWQHTECELKAGCPHGHYCAVNVNDVNLVEQKSLGSWNSQAARQRQTGRVAMPSGAPARQRRQSAPNTTPKVTQSNQPAPTLPNAPKPGNGTLGNVIYPHNYLEHYIRLLTRHDKINKEVFDFINRQEVPSGKRWLRTGGRILRRFGESRFPIDDEDNYDNPTMVFQTVAGHILDLVARRKCGCNRCPIVAICRQCDDDDERDDRGKGRPKRGLAINDSDGHPLRPAISLAKPEGCDANKCPVCKYPSSCASNSSHALLCKPEVRSDETMDDLPGLPLLNDDWPRYTGLKIGCKNGWCATRATCGAGLGMQYLSDGRRKMPSPDMFPSLAHIEIKGANQNCSGVIVAKNKVLTAYHCVKDHSLDHITVRVGYVVDSYWLSPLFGGPERKTNEQAYNVSSVCFGKQKMGCSKANSGVNDWVLLSLDRPMELGSDVQPACLPFEPTREQDAECYMVGFGQPIDDDRTPKRHWIPPRRVLSTWAHIFPVERGQCNLFGISNNDATRMCHVYKPTNNATTCSSPNLDMPCPGDAGAPILCRYPESANNNKWHLTAIHSLAAHNCQPWTQTGLHMINVRMRGILDDMMRNCPI